MINSTEIAKNASVDERALRRLRWNKARSAATQALSSPITATDYSKSDQRDTVVNVDDIKVNRLGINSSKSYPAGFQPESHHSVLSSEEQSPALVGDLASGPLRHPARTTNATTFSREQNEKINFPSANDAIWKDIDSELKVALPQWFPTKVIKSTPIEVLCPKFDKQIYQFFVDKFGILEERTESKRKLDRPKRRNRMLEFFRRRKKECRKTRRILIKAGISKESPEIKDIDRHWKTLVRRHNRLRRQLALQKSAKSRKRSNANFRKDPHKFARDLFSGPKNAGKPTFTESEAQEYFCKIYRDTQRQQEFKQLAEQPQPPLPTVPFQIRCPTLLEIARHVRHKRNKAAPGFNALTYVPYKKCPALLHYVHLLGCKIWKDGSIPPDWGEAFIILLAKSAVLSEVSEFRPIALTSTISKIFFSCISARLQTFMIKNSYIERETQKGFLSGIAGCLEHSFTLFEAIREAKENTKQLVVTWIDLANAYGSVRHNLIQFALNWYHVPFHIQKLIFNYYEHLRACVKANDWSTGFFLFDIGLFQGCVLSSILFDCVFQLLLDFLKPIQDSGYKFKLAKIDSCPITKLNLAYADDLALLSRTPKGNQIACDRTVFWLNWTGTMKAKPRKCVSMGMRQFDRRASSYSHKPAKGYETLTYAPFNPKLSIDGQEINYIYNPDSDDDFKGSHFKFLGRHIHFFGMEHGVKQHISNRFSKDLDVINDCNASGFIKAWLYEFYGLRRQTWAFLVHDLDRSFANSLSSLATDRLKHWIGIYKTAEPGILYRSKSNFGLGLTPVIDHFESAQLTKSQLLFHSVCEDIRAIFRARTDRESGAGRKWRFTKSHTSIDQQTELKTRYQSQTGRQGLGNGHFKAVFSKAERRKVAAGIIRQIQQEKRLAHSVCLHRQGAWTRWADESAPYDFSWRNLILGFNDQLVKFVIHASINWVKTPDLLSLWFKGVKPHCPLCNHKPCSIHHIIASCKFALNDKRYEWRHDSVLLAMSDGLRRHITEHNKSNLKFKIPHISSSFVRAGEKRTSRPAALSKSFLTGASDWKILTDYQHANLVFPPEIISTNLRPDIVIWSPSVKKVLLLELTCPAEEGFAAASVRKLARYSELICDIETAGWKAVHRPFEVGARGFVAKSTFSCLSLLGLSSTAKKTLVHAMSNISARCSYMIYLSRSNYVWDRNLSLLRAKELNC